MPLGSLGRLLLTIFLISLLVAARPRDIAPGDLERPVNDDPHALALLPLPTSDEIREAPRRRAGNESNFERLLRPFLHDSQRRRAAQAAADPDYWTRIDRSLNADRINFLLFGYGETHEPPLTERAFIGSITIFSYDYRSKSVDLVSLTHDIRAPEVERHLRSRGEQDVGPIKIDQAYNYGGFELMRRTLENATGLAIDYQLSFRESAIAGATDRVFNGIEVDVPLAFRVNAFYLDGDKYPAGAFKKGPQRLNGVQVIQFIKTVPVEENYDRSLEHNARKHLVFKGLMESLRAQVGDIGFLTRAALFFSGEVASSAIQYDFDLRSLLIENLWQLITEPRAPQGGDTSVPSIRRTLYVVDPESGDGGVQWVRANAVTNPATRRDLESGRYKETAIEVPYHGDAEAPNLVTGYWPDVRRLIAARFGA